MSLVAPAGRLQLRTALALAIGMAAVVGGALAFEHIGGYIPCKLCLAQRIPYYVGIPLMGIAALSAGSGWPSWMTRGLLLAGGLIMAWSLWLGVHHSGVEWGWWAGPADCGVVDAPPSGGKGILDAIDAVIPPSCDRAALRILGLSFAGWNAVASLVLAAVAFRGALAR